MKIWNMRCVTEKYTSYYIKDEQDIINVEAIINKGKRIDDWKPIKLRRKKEIDAKANISHLWSIVGCFIADEKAKDLIEKYFPEKIQFLKVIDDESGDELYLSNILECIEAIDYEKSVLRIYLNKYIGGVEKYYFKDDVLSNSIFKMRLNNVIVASTICANDSFKRKIEDMKLVEMKFEELFDSEKREIK